MGIYPGISLVRKGDSKWIMIHATDDEIMSHHSDEHQEEVIVRMQLKKGFDRYFWPSIKEEGLYVMFSVWTTYDL